MSTPCWYFSIKSGTIKYAGSFTTEKDFREWLSLFRGGKASAAFFGPPVIETRTGGQYTLATGDLVTVEVSGGVADVTGWPEGIEVEVIDHDNEEAEAEESCYVHSEAVCENCGLPCEYDSEMCLCKECLSRI